MRPYPRRAASVVLIALLAAIVAPACRGFDAASPVQQHRAPELIAFQKSVSISARSVLPTRAPWLDLQYAVAVVATSLLLAFASLWSQRSSHGRALDAFGLTRRPRAPPLVRL